MISNRHKQYFSFNFSIETWEDWGKSLFDAWLLVSPKLSIKSSNGDATWKNVGLNLGFPGGASSKGSTCHTGDLKDLGLIPGSGRSPGGGHGNPLQYSGLENPMDRGAWQATVHGSQRVRCGWSNLAHMPRNTCEGFYSQDPWSSSGAFLIWQWKAAQ